MNITGTYTSRTHCDAIYGDIFCPNMPFMKKTYHHFIVCGDSIIRTVSSSLFIPLTPKIK